MPNTWRSGRLNHRLMAGIPSGCPGEEFGPRLLGYWIENPALEKLLMAAPNAGGAAVAPGHDGLATAVVLCGSLR